MHNIDWFNTLIKPVFSPPSWVFAPAWIILYSMIFVSLLIYTLHRSRVDKLWGYVFFVAQMALNLLWTPVFFGLKNIEGGLVVILLLDIFAILTLISFLRVSKTAFITFLPYVIWLFYATYLNVGFVVLN